MAKERYSGAMGLRILGTGLLGMHMARGNLSIRLAIYMRAPSICRWLMETKVFLPILWVTSTMDNGSSTESTDKGSKFGVPASLNMRVPMPMGSVKDLEHFQSKARSFTKVSGTGTRCTAQASTGSQMGAFMRANFTEVGLKALDL